MTIFDVDITTLRPTGQGTFIILYDRCTYNEADPLAITLHLSNDSAHWTFALDLLKAAAHGEDSGIDGSHIRFRKGDNEETMWLIIQNKSITSRMLVYISELREIVDDIEQCAINNGNRESDMAADLEEWLNGIFK